MRPWLAVLAWIGVGTGAVCAQELKLRMRVLDYAQVPVATLRNFQDPAREIFRDIGIDAAWPTCRVTAREGACGPLSDDEVFIKIVRSQPHAAGPGNISFGRTVRQGSRSLFAYVFWSHVEATAIRHGMPSSLLLAHVIAHEAGHLLGLEHDEGGIMNCQFSGPEILRAERGRLRFSVDEAARLRDALLPRLAAAHP